MAGPEIVPIRRDHLTGEFALPPNTTVRGFAMVEGEEVLAVACLWHHVPHQLFSRSRPGVRKKYPKQVVKMGRKVRQMLEGVEAPVFSVPEEGVESAGRFLEWLGFQPFGDGKTYVKFPGWKDDG